MSNYMNWLKLNPSVSFLSFMLMSSAHAQIPDELLGSWILQLENPQHKVVTILTVYFKEDEAKSCLGGNWKQVVVDSYKTSDPEFFPVGEPLSYELNENRLSIGRNEICDAYLQLNGELKGALVVGEYISFGWRSQLLGFFSLRRSSQQ